ncbi:uncharacterized protein METZ01_LOCUS108076, partial [marine metagenome]
GAKRIFLAVSLRTISLTQALQKLQCPSNNRIGIKFF